MTKEVSQEQDTTLNAAGDQKSVSITEAAKMNNVTRQAIYVAIKLKKLKARKDTSRWLIDVNDLVDYRRTKYSRSKSMFDGELLFDNHKGYYSIGQAAKMMGVPAQKLYYATRSGYLKASRKGAAWVIHANDIKMYQENHIAKKQEKKPQRLLAKTRA